MSNKTFSVFRNRNYSIYFSGQLLSLSGAWIQGVAESWLVYRMTHSAVWLGVIGFSSQLPAFLISPIVGVIADRFNRRKVLMVVLACVFLQSSLLAFLVFTGKIQVWHLVALAVVLGILNAFDMTIRHSFAVDMVGKEHLGSAIAANSALVNLSRMLGPAAAGFLIASVGEAWCFALNGMSTIPVFIALFLMKVPRHKDSGERRNMFRQIQDAARYVRAHEMIFPLLMLSTFVCLFAAPYYVLLPVFAKTVLHGGPNTMGFLSCALGLGAVIGVGTVGNTNRYILSSIVVWGVALCVFAYSTAVWLSLLAVFCIGHSMMGFFPGINTTIQKLVGDHMRGRVMSMYTMTFLGTMPIGSLVIGWLSDRISAPHSVFLAGIFTLLIAGVSYLLGFKLDPVLVEKKS